MLGALFPKFKEIRMILSKQQLEKLKKTHQGQEKRCQNLPLMFKKGVFSQLVKKAWVFINHYEQLITNYDS